MNYSMGRILVALAMMAFGWTASANAPAENTDAASTGQGGTQAVESRCVDALLSDESDERSTYAVSGDLVDVHGYCEAYARGQVFFETYPVAEGPVDLTGARHPAQPSSIDVEPRSPN